MTIESAIIDKKITAINTLNGFIKSEDQFIIKSKQTIDLSLKELDEALCELPFDLTEQIWQDFRNDFVETKSKDLNHVFVIEKCSTGARYKISASVLIENFE